MIAAPTFRACPERAEGSAGAGRARFFTPRGGRAGLYRRQKNPVGCHPEEPLAVLSETKEGSRSSLK